MDVTCIWESGMFILGNDNKYSLTFAFANLFCYRTQTICQNPKVTSEGHATFLLILSSLQMNGCPNCSSKISQKGGVTAFHFPGLSSWKGMSFIDTNSPLLGRNSLFHRCYKDGIWYSFLFVCFCFVSVFLGGYVILIEDAFFWSAYLALVEKIPRLLLDVLLIGGKLLYRSISQDHSNIEL